jgi:DNA processing protein
MNSKRSIDHDGADPGLDPAELRALLRLRMLRVPDATLNQLLPAHSPSALAHRFGQSSNPEIIERRIASALREIARMDASVLTVADARYPASLHQLEAEKPPMLFYRGDPGLLDRPIVAIVGMRRSTEYGNQVAETLAADLTRFGVTVISGLALGIDAHAHRGALEAGGTTIAVLGCGIDVWYPQRNARLQERIAREGLLISEFAPGEPAMKHHFLQRNRLIAKLAGAVVVVEAGVKSGSLNTVEWAAQYGVQVCAVPGPIGREASRGTNALIADGVKVITSVRDIIEELPYPVTPLATSPVNTATEATATGTAARILQVLGPVGMQIDHIARAAQCGTAQALAWLAELELAGLVRQLPGKRFVRSEIRTEG